MDKPLRAHTLNEVQYYLIVTACAACGKGPQILQDTRPAEDARPAPDKAAEDSGDEQPVVVEAECEHCGEKHRFEVLCQQDLPLAGPEAELISTSDEPSALVDLHQWLSLFYMLIESAASQDDAVRTRREGYRAALCLTEALKFYSGTQELPPESAFFADWSRQAFREHPEKFARRRLLDMRAKLPKITVMAGNVQRDERHGGRKWWQFWKREKGAG